MNIYLSVSLCFIPLVLIFILSVIYSKVKILTSLTAVVLGFLSVIPIVFFQYLLNTYIPKDFILTNATLYLLLNALIFNGLLEEGVKFGIQFILPAKNIELKQFMALSLIFGITLGCFESVIYLLNHLQEASEKNAELIYSLIFARMISADLIHTFCAALLGFSVYSIKNKKFYISPVIVAVLTHGIFNFFSYFKNFIQWFAIVVVLFAIIEVRVKYLKVSEDFKPVKKAPKRRTKKSENK